MDFEAPLDEASLSRREREDHEGVGRSRLGAARSDTRC